MIDDAIDELGAAIKSARLEKRMTRAELARTMGITPGLGFRSFPGRAE